jgi:hypothetical protein
MAAGSGDRSILGQPAGPLLEIESAVAKSEQDYPTKRVQKLLRIRDLDLRYRRDNARRRGQSP